MKKTILFLALFSVILILTSCQKGEEITITKYFHAMQTNDNETMASMALVPKDIEFKSYKIVSSNEPEEKDLELPKLEKKLAELNQAKKQQVDIALDKRDELDDAQFELEETRRRTKRNELEKKIEELELQVAEEERKVREIQENINKMDLKIKSEKKKIAMSANVNENYDLYSGKSNIIKIVVNVTLTNGEVKDYVFILRKDLLKLKDRFMPSRYIITTFETVEDFNQMQQEKEEEASMESEEVTEEPSQAEETTEQQ